MVKLDRYIGSSVFMAIIAVLRNHPWSGNACSHSSMRWVMSATPTPSLMSSASVLLTAPRRLYEMLPMAALIGCLIGLGSLAGGSKLTVMRAAGVSIGRIVWAVMKPMLVLMAGWRADRRIRCSGDRKTLAQANRSLAQGSGDAQSAKHGMWHHFGEEFIHINAVQPNGLLYGVTRYHFDKERCICSVQASLKKAEFDGQSLAAHRCGDDANSMSAALKW